jgi:hypothetical protein
MIRATNELNESVRKFSESGGFCEVAALEVRLGRIATSLKPD